MASIQDLYLQILGRPADPGGKAFYEQQLASGTKTLDQIAADLQYAVDTGAENKALNQAATQQTIAAYKSVLGRDPTDPNNLDLEGLGFYTAKNINEGTGAVVNDLVYSTEGQKIEQAKIQTRQDEQAAIRATAEAAAADRVAARNNQIADTLQKTVDRAQAVGDTNTVNKLTDQIARLRGETTDTTKTGTTLTGTTVTGATGADPNRVQAVTDLYWNTFYRAPDAEGLAFYTTGDGKNIPINELAGVLQNEPEGRQVANVANLYTTYFGRAPDAEGVRTFVDRFGDTIDDQELFYFLDTGRLNNENLSQAGLDFIADYTGSRDFENIDPGFRKQAVSDLFRNVFYRDPDEAGLEYYTIGGGKDIPLDQLRQTFLASPEGIRVTNLASMYKDYFGRDPDPEGLRYYYDMFGETIDPSERFFFLDTAKQQGTETLSQAALDFLSSYQASPPPPGPGTEGTLLAGQTATADPRRVTQLYYELLGRAPDQAGLEYWSSQPAYNLESSFYKTAVPEMQKTQAEQLASIPITTAIPQPIIGQPSEPTAQELYLGLGRAPDPAGLSFWENYSQPNREAAFAAEAQKQGLAYDPTKPMTIGLPGQPTTTSLSGMTPQQRDLARLMVSKMPTAPTMTAPSMFSPENVSAQLELERLRLQPTPTTPVETPVETPDETPVAGFAEGGLVGNDINRLLQNQRNAIMRDSQSRQMLNTLGAPPVKKLADGGPAGSSSGVRRLEMSKIRKRQEGSPPEGEISNDEFIKSLGDRSREDLATIKEAITEIGKNKTFYADLEKKGYTPRDIEDPVKNAAYGLFLTSKTSDDPQRFLSTLSPFYDSKIEFDYTTDRSTLGEVQPYSTEARVYTTGDRGVALHELVHTLQMRRAKDIAEGKKEINKPMSRTVGDKVFQRAADLVKKGEITFPATNWKQDKGELMANVYDMSRKYEEAGKDFTKSIEFKKLFPDEESRLYYYTQTLPDTSVVYPAGSSFEPIETRDKSKSYARQLLGFAAGGEITKFIKDEK